MAHRWILLTAVLGFAGCGATPASLGITGPGVAGPASFTAPPAEDDSAIGLPGIPNSGSPYQPSNLPAGEAAKPGGFYGYN